MSTSATTQNCNTISAFFSGVIENVYVTVFVSVIRITTVFLYILCYEVMTYLAHTTDIK